jgi:hypothetical protein
MISSVMLAYEESVGSYLLPHKEAFGIILLSQREANCRAECSTASGKGTGISSPEPGWTFQSVFFINF